MDLYADARLERNRRFAEKIAKDRLGLIGKASQTSAAEVSAPIEAAAEPPGPSAPIEASVEPAEPSAPIEATAEPASARAAPGVWGVVNPTIRDVDVKRFKGQKFSPDR
jgi:hypothetical protein